MKLASMLGTSAALSALLFSVSDANAAEKANPRQGKVTYQGSGSAERSPEYAEIWIDFQVGCRASAEEVRSAIEKISAPVWKAITSKVNDQSLTETSRTYWGNIENIQESPGSTVIATPPQPPRHNPSMAVPTAATKGSVKRVDNCSKKEVALTASVPSVFSGSQRFGVRTTDMDWAESLARTLNAKSQARGPADVKYGVTALNYDVTLATKRAMFQETLNEASLEATGKGSKFESDRSSLKYASAHYLGHKASHPAVYQPTMGESLSRGKAPKVTLELPLVYTIYAEAKDLVDNASKKTAGLESEYEVQGRAVVDADYAVLNINLGAQCQTKVEDATKALEAPAKQILGDLERFQGKRQVSETDRVLNNEPSAANAYYPYQPIEWDERNQVTKYLNLCSNQIVAAPKSGNVSDLQEYYQSYQQLGVRSSEFLAVLDLAESLQARHARATADNAATRVTVSKPVGQVTDATKRKLDITARETATAYVLKKDGPLANDIVGRKLVSAHLKGVREGVMQPSGPMMRSASMRAPSASALESADAGGAPGGTPKELQVDVVRKSNDQRPQFRMVRHFAFDYQFQTVDYAPLLNPQPVAPSAPPKAPAVTPEGPHLP